MQIYPVSIIRSEIWFTLPCCVYCVMISFNPTYLGRHQQETEPDRIFKLKECCDLLLAGGYFRARMPSLTPFDKVVGGMVWSITASNVGVDVDLLFEENSTIGERIKLSENIVKALIRMQCPTPIQSHQIQGLDYDTILPVLKWLVRKVIETRALTGDEVRALSVSQFSKNFSMPEEEKSDAALSFVDEVVSRYTAQRKYRKKADAVFESEVGRVEATLLEYEERVITVVTDTEQIDKKREKGAKVDDEEEEALSAAARAEEQRRLATLQTQLDDGGAGDKVSGSALGMIVAMRAQDIKAASEAHAKELEGAEVFVSVKDQRKVEEQKHNRLVENLKKRITEAEKLSSKRDEPLSIAKGQFDTISATVQANRDRIATLEQAIAELEAIEQQEDNKEILAKLRTLVILNETLKKQESLFKQTCKTQLAELKDMIAALDNVTEDEEQRRMNEIEKMYLADAEKLRKLKELLAQKNQEIAKINRAIDEIPTRAELLQFERRFVELYDMVAAKMVETRQYYDMYNTLNNSYHYLQNQLTILESIVENFNIGMKTKPAQEAMVKQFGLMMEGVELSKVEADSQLSEVKMEEEMLVSKYNKLMEGQRAYFKAVKEFQEECTLNEKLSAAVEQMSA